MYESKAGTRIDHAQSWEKEERQNKVTFFPSSETINSVNFSLTVDTIDESYDLLLYHIELKDNKLYC
jgi:hypothetical protein